MIPYTDHLSFGRYLKAVRLDKKISVEDVAQEIRVAAQTLLHIEREEHQHLPAEVFVKGFLRAYAIFVGANVDLVTSKYVSSLKSFQDTIRLESDQERADKKFWRDLLLTSSILVFIVMISVLFTAESQDHTPLDDHPLNETEKNKIENHPGLLPEEVKAEPAAEKKPAAVPEKLDLKILAVEETWIKIIIDGLYPREYSLTPGDRLELKADSEFNILIGNATGVKLFSNDKTLKVPGESGQVVTVQIP